jgi:DNA-binding FrmR family transcriptional regulator
VARRLSRAAGHLEAVRRMVDEGRDCPDVLLQLAAVRAALDATAKLVLADHMETCVREAATNGDADHAWRDLQHALARYMR